MTLERILQRHFAINRTCPYPQYADVVALSTPDAFTNYQFYRGHFRYDLIRQVLPRQPVTITLLRDPIDRVLSHYAHTQRVVETLDYRKNLPRFGPGLSLEEFVFSPQTRHHVENLQTHYISDRIPVNGAVDLFKMIREQEDQFELKDPPPADPQAAIAILDQFAFVGITDCFADSMKLLHYTFAWQPIHEIEPRNVNPLRPRRDQIPPAIIDRIMELNEADSILYEHGCRLLKERSAAMVEALLEEHYQYHYAAHAPRQHSVSFDFSRPVPGANWHDPEFAEDVGSFCWTGPGTQSTLDFVLATDRDLAVSFRVFTSMTADIINSTALDVNGHPVTLTKTFGEQELVYSGIIPSTTLASQMPLTRLTFKVASTIAPHDVDPTSPDERKLGLAIAWVKIEPASPVENVAARAE